MNFSAQILYACYYALILDYFNERLAVPLLPWNLLTGGCTCSLTYLPICLFLNS